MKALVRLAGLTAPYYRLLALVVLLTFLTIAANLALMATSAYLISKAAIVTGVAALSVWVTGVRLFAIARAAFRYLERLVSHALTFHVLTDLRVRLYQAIEPLSPARPGTSGDLLARSVADIETLEGFYVRVLVPPAAAALIVACVYFFLASFDPLIGLAVVFFSLVAGLALPLIIRSLSKKPAAVEISARAELSGLLVDEIQGVADLLLLDEDGGQRTRVLVSGRKLERSQAWLAGIRGAGNGFGGLISIAAAVSVLWLSIPLVTSGAISGVYLAMLVLVAIASFEAVQPLPEALQHYESSRAAGGRIFELIDTEPGVIAPVVPFSAPANSSIEFRGVCFRYSDQDSLALDDVSFNVGAGQCLGITGPSGSGKSTIVQLLLRFWDYQTGQIELGGRELHGYAIESVRELVSVVPQRIHLFNSTIRDNLLIANSDATQSQVAAACKTALLDELIDGLPNGYDTLVGANGLLLSGGERQRLAIARALLKDAPVLVLDEPTANLDADTERRLMESLRPVISKKAALLISHRPSVLALADAVIEMKDGRTARAEEASSGFHTSPQDWLRISNPDS